MFHLEIGIATLIILNQQNVNGGRKKIVETPLNNVVFTVLQHNLWHAGVTVPKISIFGMIFPLLSGRGGIAFGLKNIYIPRAISEFPNPP